MNKQQQLIEKYTQLYKQTGYKGTEEPDDQRAYRIILFALRNHTTLEDVHSYIQWALKDCPSHDRREIYTAFLAETSEQS